MLKEKIQQLAKQYADEFIAVRHHIHANPELSYKEFETSKFIQQKLQGWNIPFEVMATTGVVGLIKGKNPDKKIIALRADMDALPITEVNDVAYKSKNTGVMHACGHDVHTTCLLGAAKILSELKDEWEGTVKKSRRCQLYDQGRGAGKSEAGKNICLTCAPGYGSGAVEFQGGYGNGQCR